MVDMNRIVIIAPVDPFQTVVGGTRNYVLNFIGAVQPDNKIVLCGYTDQANTGKRIHDNVEFLPVIVNRKRKGRRFIPQSLKFVLKLYTMRRAILSRGGVLHFHRFDYALPFLFPTKKAKIVVYFHGTASKGYLMGEGIRSKLKGTLYLLLEHIILPRIDRIITVSHNDEKYYRERYPRLKDKITTIPVPLNLEDFNIQNNRTVLRQRYGLPENGKVVIFAGRFSKVKGIDLIIRAFSLLNRDIPESHLLLVGKGEEEGNLRRLVSELNVKNVKFLGSISHEVMPEILNCSDVLVLASHTEGMPTVALEALACGIPVISTRVGDVPRIIRNERIGFLIDDRDVNEIKELMKRALDTTGSFKEERVEVAGEFSAMRLSGNILDIHEELAR